MHKRNWIAQPYYLTYFLGEGYVHPKKTETEGAESSVQFIVHSAMFKNTSISTMDVKRALLSGAVPHLSGERGGVSCHSLSANVIKDTVDFIKFL